MLSGAKERMFSGRGAEKSEREYYEIYSFCKTPS